MKIGGLQKISMVDYPGKMAAVVFCPGCNLNCYYCHNRWLLGDGAEREEHTPDAVLAMLRRRLKIEDYEAATPFENLLHTPEMVRIKLAQHVGKPATAVVKKGAKVEKGAVIGRVEAADLGVNIHASMAGQVTEVADKYIEIRS